MAENRCPLIENCQQKSAVCNVQLPDETCYWFRWFRALDNPWHTGTPTEEDRYLIENIDGYNEILEWYNGHWYEENPNSVDCRCKVSDSWVIAWQKIEPYKEKEE